MKHLIIFFTLLAVHNQVWAQQKTNLELLDIFDMEYVSDPQISPDGKQVVYVRNFKDIMSDKNLSNLWIVSVDGSRNRPLTSGNYSDSSPQWSPDGKKITYFSNQSGGRKLYLLWLDSRESFPLTNGPQSPGSVSWSYDNQFLAFSMFVPEKPNSLVQLPEKPEGASWGSPPIYIDRMNYRGDGEGYLKSGYRQLFVLSLDGGTPRQLTHSKFDHGSPIWSKDGKKLFFFANLHEDHELEPMNSEIYELNLQDGGVRALTDRIGPDGSPVLSPDGKTLAYTGFDDRYQGYQQNLLYLMNSDGSNIRELPIGMDRDIASIQWSGDGRGIYFMYDEEGNTKIAKVSLDGKVNTVADGLGGLSLGRPYTAASYSVSEDGTLAYTLGNTGHPADLAVVRKGDLKRLTAVNDDLFSFRQLGEVEELRWKSSFDQREVQGWIIKPPNFEPGKKYPVILEIHGGPFLSYGPVFSAELQLFASRGYVVLYANPRGSTGYGEEFGNLIHHDYPNHDYDDLMSGIDALLAKGYADPDRLFVTGGSGGGVLTAWIVGKTDRFQAAVVAKPVINWYSFVLYADQPGFFYKYWFPNKPWEDPSNYLERSPLSLVGNVTTPTMLLTGEEDFRTPIAESEQYYAALKLEKVETAIVRIPEASHGIANKPSHLIAKVASILAWFEKHDPKKTTEKRGG